MQTIKTIKRGLGLALVAAMFVSATAVAQATYDSMDEDWWNSLETQLTESAASDIAQIRQEAYRHIIFFAENYSDHVDFKEAAYEIMGRFEASDNVSERILGLAALSAIGEELTLQRLEKVADAERSPRVREMAQAVLRAHAASL